MGENLQNARVPHFQKFHWIGRHLAAFAVVVWTVAARRKRPSDGLHAAISPNLPSATRARRLRACQDTISQKGLSMNVSQAEALLSEAKKYYFKREKNIFDLGARRYFENPTTDLLAFFLDPEAEHDLKDCFLYALLDCVGGTGWSRNLNKLSKPPQREAHTGSRKRMDLLLYGDGWGLMLENKIFSAQDNLFSEYEKYFDEVAKANQWSSENKKRVILSPSGESQVDGWIGLKYADLIRKVREQLEETSHESQPLNKWRILADEFLLHLENLTMKRAMNSEALNFVFARLLPQFDTLMNLRDQATDALDAMIIKALKMDIPECELYPWRATWSGDPILRYGCWNFGKDCWSNVTLCCHAQLVLRVYLTNMNEPLKQNANDRFRAFPCARSWEENKKSVLVFEWKFEEFKENNVIKDVVDKIIKSVVDKMKILIDFEAWRLKGSAKSC